VTAAEWLDALDQAHAAIEPPISRFAGLAVDNEYPTDVNARYADGGSAAFAECYGEDSAALIVAAVNAMPGLIAALRAVLDLHELDVTYGQSVCMECTVYTDDDRAIEVPAWWPCPTVRAVGAALGVETGAGQ
jgi:hypothetical protein